MQSSTPPDGRYPPSWQLPPGALPNPSPAPEQAKTKRRDLERDEDPTKAASYETRREQVQTVALNIFLGNAGSSAILIAGRCGKWFSPEESVALANAMRARTLEILQQGQQEIPKAEVVRFYTDFMANPLMRIRDQLASQPQLVQECNILISNVNRMEETAIQEQINQFLDRAEPFLRR